MNKKGFELQFHWIFILIAGALILAFFFGVAQKQSELSQERLQLTLAIEMENIFTGAIISKGTAQKLPVPPQGIEFECNEGCACEFRIEKAAKQFGDKAMFAPALLADQDITVWAQEFKLPYRVTNFLYLTNPNIKYYLVYENETLSKGLLQQITNLIPSIISYETKTIPELTSLKAENYQHTKFVLLNVDPPTLDDSFRKANANAIKIDQNGISFYEKEGTRLTAVKYLSYVGLPSIYAAIFSADHTMYECGLRTAFRKLSHVSKIYAERAETLQEKALETEKVWCTYGTPDSPSTMIGMLTQQNEIARELSKSLDQSKIAQLSPIMQQLDSLNRNMVQQSCPELF